MIVHGQDRKRLQLVKSLANFQTPYVIENEQKSIMNVLFSFCQCHLISFFKRDPSTRKIDGECLVIV